MYSDLEMSNIYNQVNPSHPDGVIHMCENAIHMCESLISNFSADFLRNPLP